MKFPNIKPSSKHQEEIKYSPPARFVGIHHYRREDAHSKSRIHLRIDPDGYGTLIVNANTISYLNPTATIMAYLYLEGSDPKYVINYITKEFNVSKKNARKDYTNLIEQIEALLDPEKCAICTYDDFEIVTPFSARPTAPYRMDLAVTYRCNNDCAHCYNARPRNYPEMTTDEWKAVIDKTWALAIPHLVFTGGEPTLRNDL